MPQCSSREVGQNLKAAARTAFVTFFTVICISIVRPLINGLFDGKWYLDWEFILVLAGLASVLVFVWTFVSGYFSQRAFGPAQAVLDRIPSLSMDSKDALSGFVGMEYYALILNRTYVVFAAHDGLYGWKAEGPVSNLRPRFYEPYQEMLADPELIRDLEAVRDLASLNGGFFIPSSDILSFETTDKSKWGMGGIPHSGKIWIKMTNGKSREFILLGSVSPESIRDQILSSVARSAASAPLIRG